MIFEAPRSVCTCWLRGLLAAAVLLCTWACAGEETHRIGETCLRDGECASGRCDELVCKAADPRAEDEACSHPLECRSEHCMVDDGGQWACGPGLRKSGVPCTDDLQCFDSVCRAGICGGPHKDAGSDSSSTDGGTPPDARDDRPRDLHTDGAVDGPSIPDLARDQGREQNHDVARDVAADSVPGADLALDQGRDLTISDRTAIPRRLSAPLHFDTRFMRGMDYVGWDGQGNLVLGMQISQSVSFGPGYDHTVVGTFDMLAASFDAQGKHRWSRRFGGDTIEGLESLIVSGDSIYLTGFFRGELDFGGTTLTSTSGSDIYLARLRADTGATAWARQFGTASGADTGRGLAMTPSGNVVLAGHYGLTINFGGADLPGTPPYASPFTATFSPSGAHLRSQRYGSTTSPSSIFARAVTVDGAGNTYLTGRYGGNPANFGGNDLPLSGIHDEAFVVSHTAAGVHRWSAAITTKQSTHLYGTDIAVSPNGQRVAVVGGLGDDLVHSHAGQAGGSSWSKRPGGTTRANAVVAGPSGQFYLCGYTRGASIDFGGGAFTPVGTEGFVVAYAADGTFLWLKRYAGSGSDQVYIDGLHAAHGITTIAGTYIGSVDLDGTVLSGTDGAFVYTLP